MYYRHELDYKYPEKSDEHMIEVKHLRDVVLDESYPYLQKTFWFKCQRVFFWIALNTVAFWLLRITHGLKVHGRENLKAHKEEFKDGVITVSNHVFMWDFMCIMKAIRPKLSFFPAWKTNLEGPNGPLIRMAGGIPVPTESFRSMIKFKQTMEELFESKKWVHFFPEGSLWFYYPDIRPLKKAVFQYAVKYDRPVLPITLSFRPRNKLQRLFGRTPLVDVNIGEPLYADKALKSKEAVEKLHAQTYHIMQVMNGIDTDSPTYNTNQSIAEYKKTM